MAEQRKSLDHAYGVLKPVGHVVISFASAAGAAAAQRALAASGLADDALRPLSDAQMRAQLGADLRAASPLATIGQEANLAKAQLELARLGYHFLVVRVDGDGQARQVAAQAKAHGAERAQHYGHFVIEELIEHADDEAQVAESPARGLDSQTPSGAEAQRARARPARR